MNNEPASKEYVNFHKCWGLCRKSSKVMSFIGKGSEGMGTRLEKLANTRPCWAFQTSTLLRYCLMLSHPPHPLFLCWQSWPLPLQTFCFRWASGLYPGLSQETQVNGPGVALLWGLMLSLPQADTLYLQQAMWLELTVRGLQRIALQWPWMPGSGVRHSSQEPRGTTEEEEH